MMSPFILPSIKKPRWRFEIRTFQRYPSAEWSYFYQAVCARGGVHYHVDGPWEHDGGRYSSGLELHSATPLADIPPQHTSCWLIGRPCWCDGTSLYANEWLLPIWQEGDIQHLLHTMISFAEDHLYPEEHE